MSAAAGRPNRTKDTDMADDGAKRKGLGRGLSALLGDAASAVAPAAAPPQAADANAPRTGLREVAIELLRPGRFQPRRRFDESSLDELAQSIRERGLLQPIIVRRDRADAGFEIVAGERRWRAAQRAQLHHVPVIVKELTDTQALEVGLIENVQRRDLTPIEEAAGYRRLMDEFGYTQEELSEHVGKSRSQIANLLRLLTLPPEVQRMLDDARLSVGQARPLIGRGDAVALARRIVEQALSSREAEMLTRAADRPAAKAPGRARSGGSTERAPAKDADTRALERELGAALGLKVFIHHGAAGGELILQYRTLDQLDDLCLRLRRTPDQRPDDEDPI